MQVQIAVTGMGLCTAHGASVTENWNSLIRGVDVRTPIHPTYHFDPTSFSASCTTRNKEDINMAGGIHKTDTELIEMLGVTKSASYYGRSQLLACLAAREAIQDANLTEHQFSDVFGYAGATTGTITKELYALTEEVRMSEGRPSLKLVKRVLSGILPSISKNTHRLHAAHFTTSGLCVSSAQSMVNAIRTILCGDATVMLCVAEATPIHPTFIAMLGTAGVLTNITRPYQKERVGFHISEGGAALVLEEYEHAVKRGATIHAKIIGYGDTSDGDPKTAIMDPGVEGGIRAAQRAITRAGISVRDIGYVNTHGTGTELGDIAEIVGINAWADPDYPPLVSSTKSAVGHLLAAAGALEAILTITMMRNDTFLPTYGLTPLNIDARCVHEGVRHLYAIETHKVAYALSNNFGFGGTYVSIVFQKD